jgi:hypothetical protein
MATAQQLKLIFAPIMEQNPDLIIHGRLLFKNPILNYIVGVFIN